jgi:hypothetical protein
MADNDMTDALKHPHPDVPFNTVEEDKISALTTLAAIFKRKYNKSPGQHLIGSPIKAAEKKLPAVYIQPVLTYPVKNIYQIRSKTQVNTVPPTSVSLEIVTSSEGGHPTNKNCITSEGASKGAEPPPPEKIHKETSGTWAAPTTPYHWETTIGKIYQ